ncbi:hypothetical protein D3C80_1523480 [compost metagenome]
MHVRPAGQVVDDARHDQGQQAGPEQGDIGVVIGAGSQYGHQLRVSMLFDASNGLGHLALLNFIQ